MFLLHFFEMNGHSIMSCTISRLTRSQEQIIFMMDKITRADNTQEQIILMNFRNSIVLQMSCLMSFP